MVVILCISALTTSAVADLSTAEKDYTEAPYYYALLEWFDYFDYSEEQRAQFMADTEVLNSILYDDDYWDYGNYTFVDKTILDDAADENYGISLLTANYPLTGYENGTYFSKPIRGVGRLPCTHHSSGCNYNGSCGCISVDGAIQCYGFAKKLSLIYTGSYFNANSQIAGLSSSNWTIDNIKNYFNTKIREGNHVRLHLRGRPENYDHSYTILQKNTTGIKIYDANWDNQCGIRITDVTWSQIYSYFDYIEYSNIQ